MQQTNKYKLNLIEPDDPFLPDGLNANTQKIEDAMSAHEARVDGQSAAQDAAIAALQKDLDRRVGSAGKNCRITWGTHRGDGARDGYTLTFGFCPVFIIMGCGYAFSGSASPISLMVRDVGSMQDSTMVDAYTGTVEWLDDGVKISKGNNESGQMYYYAAIGYDKKAEEQ